MVGEGFAPGPRQDGDDKGAEIIEFPGRELSGEGYTEEQRASLPFEKSYAAAVEDVRMEMAGEKPDPFEEAGTAEGLNKDSDEPRGDA